MLRLSITRNEMVENVKETARQILSVRLMVEIALLAVLLFVHSYTDSVPDKRYALFNWDNLLCVDTFVVTGILILMGIIVMEYIPAFRRIKNSWNEDNEKDDNIVEFPRR